MKTTVIAATLAMLVGGQAVAYAAPSVPATNNTAAATEHTNTQLAARHTQDAREASAQPQFVGPFEVRNGLLPNGLAPNPFNYG
jgi:hypothetical protein